MIGTITANVLRFVLLLLAQVMVLDHMDLLNGWVVPYIYTLFLLMLPFALPPWATLLVAFTTGLVVDFFGSTPGMHTTACTVLGFARLQVLRLLSPRDGYETGMQATVSSMGIAWYTTYSGMLLLVHHSTLFFVELARMDRFWGTLGRALLSCSLTLLLCLLLQYLFGRPARTR
jgi:rod shape-determining protein MreD